MAVGHGAVRACFGSAHRGHAPGEAPQAVPAKDRVMQSRACRQFGPAASIRNRLRRANGATQASSLQPLPCAPAANLSRRTPRQKASSHNLYAPSTVLNAVLTPSPGHRGLRRSRARYRQAGDFPTTRRESGSRPARHRDRPRRNLHPRRSRARRCRRYPRQCDLGPSLTCIGRPAVPYRRRHRRGQHRQTCRRSARPPGARGRPSLHSLGNSPGHAEPWSSERAQRRGHLALCHRRRLRGGGRSTSHPG